MNTITLPRLAGTDAAATELVTGAGVAGATTVALSCRANLIASDRFVTGLADGLAAARVREVILRGHSADLYAVMLRAAAGRFLIQTHIALEAA